MDIYPRAKFRHDPSEGFFFPYVQKCALKMFMSHAFNCTNNFFYPYLPIHHTTFKALRFVLRPFTLRMRTARRS